MRRAEREDVEQIVGLLADDKIGRNREIGKGGNLEKYLAAFEKIDADPRNELVVAELGGQMVGTYQVTYIPYLSRGGNERALIEAVRVDSQRRGQGIGHQMMEFAIAQAKKSGCLMVQLTTDKQRPDAHKFYLSLGFTASHEGMKLAL